MPGERGRLPVKLRHEFVDYIPKQLDDHVLYVSIHFGTVIHRCPCGCGEEVVTPLGPAEWQLTYDGSMVSLAPSIGNWSFPCRSHYWIEKGSVRWARGFSETEVVLVRQEARMRRDGYYQAGQAASSFEGPPVGGTQRNSRRSIWQIIRDLCRTRKHGKE